jgi:diguanylate cyclase (GGDEF)-like protein
VDWSKLPDIVAVGLLASAFASVARRSYTRTSGLWLTGWLFILLHFASFLFVPAPGWFGTLAALIGISSLVWAGVLFMWAAIPYRSEVSSRAMLLVLIATNTLYVFALNLAAPAWALTASAALLGAGPLAITLSALRRFNHPLRWGLVALYSALAVFLEIVQRRPSNGFELALNAVMFTVYIGCTLHFWYGYRRASTGAFITIAGFFLWAAVFVAGPLLTSGFPAAHIESEVWNLPKFVVGIGMILLLLEEQIEHNKHLALHDVLTGLPNRRLFQDRLNSALERARRTGSHAALLVLDLDRFKQVNDTLGHHVGDLLLQRVAAIFSARVRRSDTVARTGGDEFSVILEAPTNSADAVHVGHSLQSLLKEPLALENHTVTIGASFGAAVFPDDAGDLEALCIAADLRMYENKRSRSITGQQPDPHKHRSAQRSSKRREQGASDWNS